MKTAFLHVATGALFSAITPLIALFVLEPGAYGQFSIVYLVAAFAISTQFSVVSEAWFRSRSTEFDIASSIDELQYFSVLTLCALLFGVAGSIAAVLTVGMHPLIVVSSGVGVACSAYRMAARYYRVARGSLRRAVASDLIGIAVFALFLFVLWGSSDAIWLSWGASALCAALPLGIPRLSRIGVVSQWVRQRRRHIGVLLTDSLLLDFGAIGVPLLLAGFMPASQFGVYRAVSSTAMPVGLLIEPLRPVLARMGGKGLFSGRVILALSVVAVVGVSGAWGVLAVLIPFTGLTLGTLSALSEYALPTALFVGAFLFSQIAYIVARGNSGWRTMIGGRAAQTIAAVIFPLLGFAIGGLSGAIWGFLASAVAPALIWLYICWVDRSESKTPRLEE